MFPGENNLLYNYCVGSVDYTVQIPTVASCYPCILSIFHVMYVCSLSFSNSCYRLLKFTLPRKLLRSKGMKVLLVLVLSVVRRLRRDDSCCTTLYRKLTLLKLKVRDHSDWVINFDHL